MLTLNTYEQADFPAIYNWQAVAFMRCEWPWIFTGDLLYLADPYPADLAPLHFVLTEGDNLLSYAAAIRLNLEHAGQTWSLAGFGNMFTFPPYRKNGYGRQVLKLATDTIRSSDAEIAMLFCDAALEPFYASQGWQTTLSPTRIGTPDQYRPHEYGIRMMLFVSEKSQQHRQAFEEQPVYVAWTW